MESDKQLVSDKGNQVTVAWTHVPLGGIDKQTKHKLELKGGNPFGDDPEAMNPFGDVPEASNPFDDSEDIVPSNPFGGEDEEETAAVQNPFGEDSEGTPSGVVRLRCQYRLFTDVAQ